MYFHGNKARFLNKLVNVAEERLKDVSVALQSVLVAGDASDSMSVAIRTATIISSLVSNVIDRQAKVQPKSTTCNAGTVTGSLFRLFTYKPVPVLKPPTGVKDILNFASTIQANGMTAPAAALHQLLASRQKVDQLIFVTDEDENTPFPATENPTFFVDALREYREKVNPNVQLIIVSFAVKGCHSSMGKMEESVRNALHMTPVVFTLNPRSPDLKKLDSLIGLLASQGGWFQHRVQQICSRLQSEWTSPLLPGLLDDAQQGFVASHDDRDTLCAALKGLKPLKKASPTVFTQTVNALLREAGYVPSSSSTALDPHARERQRQERVVAALHEVEKYQDSVDREAAAVRSAKKTPADAALVFNGNESMSRLNEPVLQHVLTYLCPKELISAASVCRKIHKQFTSLPILSALYGPGSKLMYDKHEAQSLTWTKVTQEEAGYFAQLQAQFAYW